MLKINCNGQKATSFLIRISNRRHILVGTKNDQGLTLGLSKLIDLVFLPEVDLVYGFFDLALEGVLEGRDLVVLGEGVAGHHVGGHADPELVVGVQVHLLLQLPPNVLIVVCVRTQVLVQLGVGGPGALEPVELGGLSLVWLLLLFFFEGLPGDLVIVVLSVDLLALLVEPDYEVVLLGVGDPDVIPLHFYNLNFNL